MFGSKQNPNYQTKFELLSDSNSTFYKWNGNIYQSDIVRSAIRPKVNAVGKLVAKHVRGMGDTIKINPDATMRQLLNRPNPYMSMQDFLEKMTWQREINNNAFAYVQRDIKGNAIGLYPVPYNSMKLLEVAGELFIEFWFMLGKRMTVPYTDLMHLRKDFNENDFFGDSGYLAIKDIMEIQTTTDQGIVTAIKNSAIIRWILKFKSTLRPEDVELQIDNFIKNYLSIENGGKGVASSDPRYDLEQVKSDNYIPNALQIEKTKQRLYDFFGVNDAIVQNKFTEDEFNAFYEAEIEPMAMKLSNEFTNTFFTPNQQSYGNKIIFDAANLAYASMTTKLNLLQMVDRGSMTPNEWRLVMNLGPIEGGEKPIRRLDTALVNDSAKPTELVDTNITSNIDTGGNANAE